MCSPGEEAAGIAIDAEKVPWALLLMVAGLVVIGVPSYLIVVRELAAKPLPLTVTEVLGGPETGLNVIVLGGTTVNVS